MLYKLKHSVFVFLFLAVFIQIKAQNDYEGFIVKNVEFKGNTSFSRKELMEQVTIHGTNFFRRTILRKEPFLYSEEYVQISLENLKKFYQSEGFLHARISKTIIPEQKNRQIQLLTINISQGEAVQAGNITYNFFKDSSLSSPEIQKIMAHIKKNRKIDRGQRFRDQYFQEDREMMAKEFKEAGYALASINYELNLSENQTTVNINWQIKRGPHCKIGRTIVTGNDHIDRFFILKYRSYQKGETFTEEELAKTQENLYDLGLFQIVTVKAGYQERQGNIIPVKINVKESPRLNTQFGLGYGTEDKFRTFVNFQRANLFGGARRIELLAKHSGLELYNINFKYIQPHFLTRRTTLTINPFLRHETEPGYETRRFGFNLPVSHTFSRTYKVSFNYYLEQVGQTTSSREMDPLKKSPSLYNKSGLIISTEWKTSQPMFFPEQGHFANLSYKINGFLFQSDFNYSRLLLDLRKYNRVGDMVVASRLKIGGIESADASNFVPVEDRFYSGGSMSIRGWSRGKLGPIAEDPIGGKSLLEASLELRFPVYKKLSAVIFSDGGNAWLDSYTYKFHDLRYAVGFGLRYRTPIGPVRIDIARPVADPKESFEYHLNIGQAF